MLSGWRPLNSNKVEAVAVLLVDMLFFYFVDGNRNLNEIRAKFMIKAEDFIRVLFKLLSTRSVRFETKAPTDCYVSWDL